MITLGQTQPTQGSFLVQPAGTFQTPAQTKQKTQVDWGKILSGATTFATTYLGYKAATKGEAVPPSGGATIIAPQQKAPMSKTTKFLLLGGGILVAGLIIYSITKKK